MLFSIHVLSVLATSTCFAAAVPAAAPVTSPMDKRWDHNRFWQSSKWQPSFIDFTRRQLSSDGSSVCSLGTAQMPAAPTPLPPPSAGLYLSHVAVGRGTQNYTCDVSNSTAVPAAVGALASLYNASCIAADSPALLAKLPNVALNLPIQTTTDPSSPAYNDLSGHHYFTDLTTAYFNLDTALHSYGQGSFKKINSSSAPSDAASGVGGTGNGAVAWLKLAAKNPAGQSMQEVYRLNTAGGQPPKTCAGQDASFQIQYSAEYWIWSK